MKAPTPKPANDLAMSAADFDRIMGGALAVTPPIEPKAPVRKKRAAKSASKK